MAKYKTQHDIPYLKFLDFSEQIAEHSEDPIFIADKVMELFYPNVTDNEALKVEEFSIALKRNPKRLIKYRIDLKPLEKADNFIDADTFQHEKDFSSLLKMIVKSYVPFRKVDVEKISLADGQRIMGFFLKSSKKSKSLFNIFLIQQIGLQISK